MANYVLLERIELNASAASVTFSNIPQTGYTDLKFVISGRTDAAQGATNLSFNGLTTNLTSRIIYGTGSAAGSVSYASNIRAGYIVGTDYTASTFANNEIYIPNYNSTSAYKSVSIDSVDENNATESYSMLSAGLWSSTSAITSVTLTVINNGTGAAANFVQYSTFSLYGLAAVGTTPVIAPKASGGNITTDGTYWIHTFTTSGAFVPSQALTCDYLVIAGGGGGGGGDRGGGGGAGGYRTSVGTSGGGGSAESPISVAADTSYTITVGGGGSGVGSNTRGVSGTNSTFSTITSTGGGGGGTIGSSSGVGVTGGSGGGGGLWGSGSLTAAGGSGTTNQGYAGGTSKTDNTTYGNAGGGGGAGAVGATVTGANSGNATAGYGGNGVSSTITGTAVTRAGGGGGGGDANSTSGGVTGGTGGGGTGANNFNFTTPTAGTVNTGSGGGGMCQTSSSASGGSGIVIIRYAMA